MSTEQENNRQPVDDAFGEYGDTASTIKANQSVIEPPFFRRRPDSRKGLVCADICDKPCEDCDGKTCVYEYIESTL